jgi:hypothetical protein
MLKGVFVSYRIRAGYRCHPGLSILSVLYANPRRQFTCKKYFIENQTHKSSSCVGYMVLYSVVRAVEGGC